MKAKFYNPLFKRSLLFFSFCFFTSIFQSFSQDVFWGVSSYGPLGGGSIYSINSDGTNYQQRHAFTPSIQVVGELLDYGDGFLYGISTGANSGSVVRFNADGSVFETIHFLDKQPFGRLLLGSDNMIYGTAHHFADNRPVVIFRMNPDGSGYQEIYNSDEADYTILWNEGLKTAHNGYVYSLVPEGILRISLDGSTLSVLETTQTDQSDNRISSLVQDEEGTLFGVERSGGNNFHLYRINPDGTGFETLHEFDYDPAQSFEEDLIIGQDGNIYGMFSQSRSFDSNYDFGVVFQIGRDGTGFTNLHEFEGSGPTGSLVYSNGNLYGIEVIENQGQHLFRIDAERGDFTRVLALETYPSNSSLTLGMDGNLYGLLAPFDRSLIFSISLGDYTLSSISPPALDGSFPNNLVEGPDGYFYGTTAAGGEFGHGTFFRISPEGNGFQVLQHFEVTIEFLIAGVDGDFFGVAALTESPNQLFRITAEETTSIREFPRLIRNLVQDEEGFLYGIFVNENEEYNIFKINTEGDGFQVLFTFDENHPYFPFQDAFIIAENGVLYGSARVIGVPDQTLIYSIGNDGSDFQILRTEADWMEDSYPGYILEGRDGLIYGLLLDIEGGAPELFSMQPDGSDFNSRQLSIPSFIYSFGVEGSDGYFYGHGEEQGDENSFIYRVSTDGSEASRVYISEGAVNPVGPFVMQRVTCPLPVIYEPILSDSLLAIGSEVSAYVPIPEEADWIGAVWHWGDGETSEAILTDTTAIGSHTYTQAGSYTVTLVVTDDCGTSTSPPSETVEVTDEAQPSTGSLKGTGMFFSPRGANLHRPQIKGMAQYTIDARTIEGVVSGRFQFKLADLHFRSTRLDRLLVNDNNAWLYGEGRINGKGRYGFLIAAVDGEIQSTKRRPRHHKNREKDSIRVKIWDLRKDELIYDNQHGDPDDAVATQAIDRGNIIIVEEETPTSSPGEKELFLELLKKVKAYPNPVRERFFIDLGDLSVNDIETILTDAYGHLELHNVHRANGNQLEFDMSGLRFGFYYIQIRTEHGYRSIKLLKR